MHFIVVTVHSTMSETGRRRTNNCYLQILKCYRCCLYGCFFLLSTCASAIYPWPFSFVLVFAANHLRHYSHFWISSTTSGQQFLLLISASAKCFQEGGHWPSARKGNDSGDVEREVCLFARCVRLVDHKASFRANNYIACAKRVESARYVRKRGGLSGSLPPVLISSPIDRLRYYQRVAYLNLFLTVFYIL